MVSTNTICKEILNVKNAVIEDCIFFNDADGVKHIRIKARPTKTHENDCPFCHKSCPVYDKHSSKTRTWRGLDWGGILVEIECQTHRINCPEHGIYVAEVPWAYPGSGFTKDFDLQVAWFASYLPRSTTSYFMRVDWETVDQFETIADAVMSKFGTSWSKENTKEAAEMGYQRSLIMYFCRKHTDMELTAIASRLGGETYITVAEGIHYVKDRAKNDYVFEELLKDFDKRVVHALKKAC